MKMVKKIMFGLVAAATILSLVSCDGLLNKNDEAGAIKGSGKKYTVSYNNETTNAYRAYKATTLKHAGGLVKVTFDSNNVNTSKMGIIFDLKNTKDAEGNDVKGAVDFYCIGLNPRSDVSNFYVSKFTNVTDIQAYNFGTEESSLNTDEQNAAVKANPAQEVEIVPLATANKITFPAADADGKYSVYVYYKALTDGSFDYKILNIDDDTAKAYDFAEGNFVSSAVITSGNTKAKAGTEYDACEEGNQPQNKIAFYAQVAANTELKGSWNVIGTYLEAEDAE